MDNDVWGRRINLKKSLHLHGLGQAIAKGLIAYEALGASKPACKLSGVLGLNVGESRTASTEGRVFILVAHKDNVRSAAEKVVTDIGVVVPLRAIDQEVILEAWRRFYGQPGPVKARVAAKGIAVITGNVAPSEVEAAFAELVQVNVDGLAVIEGNFAQALLSLQERQELLGLGPGHEDGGTGGVGNVGPQVQIGFAKKLSLSLIDTADRWDAIDTIAERAVM